MGGWESAFSELGQCMHWVFGGGYNRLSQRRRLLLLLLLLFVDDALLSEFSRAADIIILLESTVDCVFADGEMAKIV